MRHWDVLSVVHILAIIAIFLTMSLSSGSFLLFALHAVILQNCPEFLLFGKGGHSHTGEHDSCGARMSLVVVADCLCMRLGSSIVCMKKKLTTIWTELI